MTAPKTPVIACPKPYVKHPEGVQITSIPSASQQSASTTHTFVKRAQNCGPKVVRVFERPTSGIKYVKLDNGHWYKLKYASKARQLNGQQHVEAVDSSNAPVIDSGEGQRKQAESIRQCLTGSTSLSKANTLEDYNREVKKVIARLKEMERQVTKILIRQQGKVDQKGGVEGKKGIKGENTEKRSSRRKRPQEMKWHDHEFVARNGLLSAWGNNDKRRGHKLRHRCTWIPVPEKRPIEQLSGDVSVPGLVLTSAEGGNFSLHDPAEL
ncbi:hypothetical protein GE21DRAFT_2429 [Neurospora crassa]|uniref:Uncharacterized protein n=2 Tax=Neurospora crassa TaxID=5141 RepID=Q7SDC8_NEUCR|nr:hypothetical protein NCU02864 [Neurospora crassa OR74A]EAA34762.1 hypothetical protein NCU02864 [Neurospora crassa OR74A]KHE78689.1 hypothetical protein GE21DRAFT_2429 [Neurospora crassa]CAE76221.1 hypothetical protein [Neurospora crassa]|eukprot:XP_963998.1 hypothetical protein NCU02864 [Neurospora crassa OR74A]